MKTITLILTVDEVKLMLKKEVKTSFNNIHKGYNELLDYSKSLVMKELNNCQSEEDLNEFLVKLYRMSLNDWLSSLPNALKNSYIQ